MEDKNKSMRRILTCVLLGAAVMLSTGCSSNKGDSEQEEEIVAKKRNGEKRKNQDIDKLISLYKEYEHLDYYEYDARDSLMREMEILSERLEKTTLTDEQLSKLRAAGLYFHVRPEDAVSQELITVEVVENDYPYSE